MKREITILEDDQDIRDICTYLFTSEGYKVNDYGTISAFKQSTTIPDIYLLDIRLPDGNGLDICHCLKNHPLSANIPVIMMSAHLEESKVREQCRAEKFIAKPFHIENLLSQAALLISSHRNQQ